MAASSSGLFVRKDSGQSKFPSIDFDNFRPDVMSDILTHWGSYRLEGPSADALSVLITQTMGSARELLTKPIDELRKCDHNGSFNGFQNVKAQSIDQVKSGKSAVIRSQIAFHFKPYLSSRLPHDIDRNQFDLFYHQMRSLAIKHYLQIAEHFIHEDILRSDLKNYLKSELTPEGLQNIDTYPREKVLNELRKVLLDASYDKKSVLMMRRYEAKKSDPKQEKQAREDTISRAKVVGIPAHSDHNEITIVVANKPGLEVFKGGKWIQAENTSAKWDLFVNWGDWGYFKTLQSATLDPIRFGANKFFKEGLHRVLEIEGEEDRLALIFAKNPAPDEVTYTPLAGFVQYEKFLQQPKSVYRDTSRDKSAESLNMFFDSMVPRNPILISKEIPKLYVREDGVEGQVSVVLVNGKNNVLCSPETQTVSEKAHESFSYGILSLDEIERSCLPKAKESERARTFEITLKYQNDVYVVDEASASMGKEEDQRAAISHTLIPLKDYKGDYKKPVYLIQRPLCSDEVTELHLRPERVMKFKS